MVSDKGKYHRVIILDRSVSMVLFINFMMLIAAGTSVLASVAPVAIFVTENDISYLV